MHRKEEEIEGSQLFRTIDSFYIASYQMYYPKLVSVDGVVGSCTEVEHTTPGKEGSK
jgi:hypothetical protein